MRPTTEQNVQLAALTAERDQLRKQVEELSDWAKDLRDHISGERKWAASNLHGLLNRHALNCVRRK